MVATDRLTRTVEMSRRAVNTVLTTEVIARRVSPAVPAAYSNRCAGAFGEVSMGELTTEVDEVIACLLSEREQAIRGEEIAQTLFAHVAEVAELPDGYGYRFDEGDAWLDEIMAFIAAERRCCPFLTFEVAFEPHNGPVWLRLRGSSRVKAFIAETFGERVGAADAAGGRQG
jgi:hypothetical protein